MQQIVRLPLYSLIGLLLVTGGCQGCNKSPLGLSAPNNPKNNSGTNKNSTTPPPPPTDIPQNGVTNAVLAQVGSNPAFSFLRSTLQAIRDGSPFGIEDMGGNPGGTPTTALAQAVKLGNTPIINLLLQKEAEQYPNPKQRYANTVRACCETMDKSLLDFLLQQPGINLDVKDPTGVPMLSKLLNKAYTNNNGAFLKTFLADPTKFDINSKDAAGNVSINHLFRSIPFGPSEKSIAKDILKIMLQIPGIDLTGENDKNETPLHIAIDHEPEWVEELLASDKTKKINVNAQDQMGYTALHYLENHSVYSSSHKNLLKKLMNRGANPTIKDNNGNTVLHLILGKHKDKIHAVLCRLLNDLAPYKAKFNFSLTNNAGKTVDDLYNDLTNTISDTHPIHDLWDKLRN